jgi:hypothetical protein
MHVSGKLMWELLPIWKCCNAVTCVTRNKGLPKSTNFLSLRCCTKVSHISLMKFSDGTYEVYMHGMVEKSGDL